MGSVPRYRVTEAWNGEVYQQLRRRLVSGEVHAACRHCHVMGRDENPDNPLAFVKGPREES